MSKQKIEIPKYSLSEELISAISHGAGAVFGIVALIWCLVVSISHKDPWAIASACVYGTTLVLMYTMSTIYHGLKVNRAKRVFRVIDHCSIYLLIAGTYTPYTLVSLRGALGWTLFGIIWICAIVAIALKAIDMKRYRVFSMVAYIVMGWAIVFAIVPLIEAIGTGGTWYLVGGGVIYTLGTIFYGLGRKVKYMHSIFHFFVLAGSVLHFVSIIKFVL